MVPNSTKLHRTRVTEPWNDTAGRDAKAHLLQRLLMQEPTAKATLTVGHPSSL